MTVLIVDGANFMHRARSGFQLGQYNIVYNFFRNLKALVEQFEPTRVYFTLEGHPKRRLELLPSYKGNRLRLPAPEAPTAEVPEKVQKQLAALADYHRQADLIVDLLARHFPFSVVRHPDHEADDLVLNLVKNASNAVDFVVVSTDSDFTSLLQRFDNVHLYHPIDKRFVEAPVDYSYVHWKAIRGDGTDNVPKLPGMDDDRAAALLTGPIDELQQFLVEHGPAFERNVRLVRLMEFTPEELEQVESSSPTRDWEAVRATFDGYGFKSILKDPYWGKFQGVFDRLWPT